MTLDLTDATIVFDLDGTLVDTAPDLAAAANHALGLVGLEPLAVGQLQPFIGHGSKAMIDAGLRIHDKSLSDGELTQLHDQFLRFYAENVAVASRPFEGIPELLDELADGGARLAVCTNKVERLSRLLLGTLGLDRRFAAIAGRDTFEMFKPAPGHLTGTIEKAGGRADRAVMVGDSEVDIATAAAAGVPSIFVTFGYTARPVHELKSGAVIGHYREFMPALARVAQWGAAPLDRNRVDDGPART
jgi:phosphoglycolate phosphatase